MRHILVIVLGFAAAVMLAAPAVAGAVPGKTLYYKKTYEGTVTRTIAAATKAGQVAIFWLSPAQRLCPVRWQADLELRRG